MRKTIFQIIKASAAAIVISLLFVLIFTLIIQLFSLPTTAVKPVNGLIAVLATYLLYGLISRSLSVSWTFAIEIVLGIVAGAISGVIAVNIKKGA